MTSILKPQDWVLHKLRDGPCSREDIRNTIVNGRTVQALTKRSANKAICKLRAQGLIDQVEDKFILKQETRNDEV